VAGDERQVGWCIIPPWVLADQRLSSTQKLLLGRVLGLSDKHKYCWASNEWLGQELGIAANTVSHMLTDLERMGLVRIELRRVQSGTFRKIFPTDRGEEIDLWSEFRRNSHSQKSATADPTLAENSIHTRRKQHPHSQNSATKGLSRGTEGGSENIEPPPASPPADTQPSYAELPDTIPDLMEVAVDAPEKWPHGGSKSYPKAWTTVCQKAMDILRGERDAATGYNATAKACKEAWKRGDVPADWVRLAIELFTAKESGVDWLARITGPTVTKMLPDWKAGKLDLRPRGKKRPQNVYHGRSSELSSLFNGGEDGEAE